MTDAYHGQRFLIRKNGVIVATPLLAVLVLVEVTDIVFAVDSIPAIFAVTDEPFLVFTANAFAILGLRALYFLLADLIDRFVYLKTGLAIVLVWVGGKMMLHIWDIKIPTLVSLGVVMAIITVSVVLSLRATRGLSSTHGDAAPEAAADAGAEGEDAGGGADAVSAADEMEESAGVAPEPAAADAAEGTSQVSATSRET